MQLVNVNVIWFVYCRVNANEVGWLVNRSVAGAVGKHWIGTGKHVYNIENNCQRLGLNCDQLPYKSISNFGDLMACITNLMKYCFSIRGIEFGLLNMHLIYNGSTAVFFPLFFPSFFSVLWFSINCKHPKKDLVSTSDTYFERPIHTVKILCKAVLKQKTTSQMVKSFQKLFEIWRILSKAKGILQQRNSLIVCMCVKFCTMKKDWSADGRWFIAFDLPAMVIWPWWWYYLYNKKIVVYLSVLFIPTSSKPNNFNLFIIIVLFLSLIDLQICNIKFTLHSYSSTVKILENWFETVYPRFFK